LDTEDIALKIKEMVSNLGGYVTNYAALFLLAKEYGLDFSAKESRPEFCDELEEKIELEKSKTIHKSEFDKLSQLNLIFINPFSYMKDKKEK